MEVQLALEKSSKRELEQLELIFEMKSLAPEGADQEKECQKVTLGTLIQGGNCK